MDTQSDEWIIDSDASRHMTFQINVLYNYEEFVTPEPVGLGDGYSTSAIGCGKVKVTTRQGDGKKIVVWVTDVLYVPKLANNLFNDHAATSKGNTVLFGHTDCCIRNKHGKVIVTGSPSTYLIVRHIKYRLRRPL